MLGTSMKTNFVLKEGETSVGDGAVAKKIHYVRLAGLTYVSRRDETLLGVSEYVSSHPPIGGMRR
jgi:hypothetical protein